MAGLGFIDIVLMYILSAHDDREIAAVRTVRDGCARMRGAHAIWNEKEGAALKKLRNGSWIRIGTRYNIRNTRSFSSWGNRSSQT